MKRMGRHWLMPAVAAGILLAGSGLAHGACCYFSAKDADILQPAQKAFLTWDPVKKLETFTVQPKFEGNALDFGMVIPTPTQPKLHEMPRDFFANLAVYTILKKPEFPQSKLLPQYFPAPGAAMPLAARNFAMEADAAGAAPRPPAVKVLEAGVVGSLDYKVIEAGRADDLFQWLKDNRYSYSGDEATLDFYVQKRWVFTVMKIDTMQMKKNKDGSYAGEVTPTRFAFSSDRLVYPLKITQLSVRDKTEALFYVQAPQKMDLESTDSYRHTWVPMLQAASGCTPGGLPGNGGPFLEAIKPQIPALERLNNALGIQFQPGTRPGPDAQGHVPTTMEWAKKLTARDIEVLVGKAPYSERVPDVDEGFTQADLKDAQRREAVFKVIRERLAEAQKERPFGYLVREAPKEDVERLRQLSGHLREGLWVVKFRKVFARDEMADDLVLVPSRFGEEEDTSEYTQTLPVSPP